MKLQKHNQPFGGAAGRILHIYWDLLAPPAGRTAIKHQKKKTFFPTNDGFLAVVSPGGFGSRLTRNHPLVFLIFIFPSARGGGQKC